MFCEPAWYRRRWLEVATNCTICPFSTRTRARWRCFSVTKWRKLRGEQGADNSARRWGLWFCDDVEKQNSPAEKLVLQRSRWLFPLHVVRCT